MSKPAIFLDRDGTIFFDTGYPGDDSRIIFIPGVIDMLKELQKTYRLIIISNQSGVGRGIITKAEMKRVHHKMMALLSEEGVQITDIFYCLHAPSENCSCRKPNPHMIFKASEKWNVDLEKSYMIGDKLSDAKAGYRAGCTSILLTKNNKHEKAPDNQQYPTIVFPDLQQAGHWILNQSKNTESKN